jgi:glycosyltransferase involved in cell wall biosynthesis
MELTVIMPALNEEKNILLAINNTFRAFEEFKIEGELLVVNDGSTDSTQELLDNFAKSDSRLRVLRHNLPQGIGACFWDGVDNASFGIICLIPSDNEIEPEEILRYLSLMKDVDMVVPFVFNRQVRSKARNIISSIFKFIINTTFCVSLNYTNGTVIYRRSALIELEKRNNGFFYQADILVRLIKRGYLFAEVPYRLSARKEGKSKAISLRSLSVLIRGYILLIKDIYFSKKEKERRFTDDSATKKRHL